MEPDGGTPQSMKPQRIERLLKLIQALESGRSRTADDLAAFAGISRRTVFRDLGLLERCGIRYHYDRETKRYSAERESLLPPVTLSHAEAMTLMLAARHMANSPLVLDAASAESAGLKLESMLPAAIRDDCGPILGRTEIRDSPASDSTSIREAAAVLQVALIDQKKVHVEYDSYYEGKVIATVLHPYRLAYIHRGWYLIAHSEEASAVQTYKVERIMSLRLLETGFVMTPGFCLEAYFGNAWLMIRGDERFHVRIRFLPKVAGNVDEVLWHKTQQTLYEEDGSLLFEVDVDGIEEISWWVLGYGDQAEVLEPPELRELIAQRVARMHDCYSGNGARQRGHEDGPGAGSRSTG